MVQKYISTIKLYTTVVSPNLIYIPFDNNNNFTINNFSSG